MTPTNHTQDRAFLQRVAIETMRENDLLTEYSAEVMDAVNKLAHPAEFEHDADYRDLRDLLWSSIDNDDSEDLDQLTVAEELPDGNIRILVAIADVDSLVKKGSALDKHAGYNTATVYTPAIIFPMLPEKLSTNLTSLNPGVDRLAMVTDMVFSREAELVQSEIYQAIVRNHAKLAYNSLAAWLENEGDMPDALKAVDGLPENIRLQDTAAQLIRQKRFLNGALTLQTIQAVPVFDGDEVVELKVDERNRTKELIEDFMIAVNNVTARFLDSKGFPSIRRVVRVPKRWDRIVDVAEEYGYQLTRKPNSVALNEFLVKEQKEDPERFPDLSLTIIKLLGSGEYVAEKNGKNTPGHFSLSVKDYTHSTAPNRRYPDLITQRLLKAAIAGEASPYTFEELDDLAKHITLQEDIETKVERKLGKAAAALVLENRIGEGFSAFVTGAAQKGYWVRIIEVPVEGKLVSGTSGLDVGDRIQVELTSVNAERGFIDFKRLKKKNP